MEVLTSLLAGFGVALQPVNLLYLLLGVLIGSTVGALPGIGPATAIALLLPLTFDLSPAAAIIMLAGIYYGAMYGGRIASILLNLPGDPESLVTTFDGYPMAQQGRAGPALGITAIASFIGGTVSVIGLTFAAFWLSRVALRFGPPEFLALTVLGILLIAYLGSRSFSKSLILAGCGFLLASVGIDPILGTARFTFGSASLLDGFNLVAVMIGLFGVGEMLYNLEQEGRMRAITGRISRIWPSLRDWAQSRGAILRGSIVGFPIGALPGGGALISTLASYALEKRRAKEPERFGKGAIEGVAAPEASNNAASTSGFIPLLTLGIPPNPVLALLYGALLLQGITPGPELINKNPDVFWGVIASLYLGNLMLLVLSIPLVGLFVRLLRLRLGILASITVMIIMVGAFSVNSSIFDMWVVLAFGALGYVMRKTGFEPGPLVLALVLGPIMERSFRQSLLISNGDLGIFLTRPISGTILGIVLVVLAFSLFRYARKGRRSADTAEEAQPGQDDKR